MNNYRSEAQAPKRAEMTTKYLAGKWSQLYEAGCSACWTWEHLTLCWLYHGSVEALCRCSETLLDPISYFITSQHLHQTSPKAGNLHRISSAHAVMVHLGSGYLQYFTHVVRVWGQRYLYTLQCIDKDVPVTELHGRGSSSQARGKTDFILTMP